MRTSSRAAMRRRVALMMTLVVDPIFVTHDHYLGDFREIWRILGEEFV
jgi:hypothetical protein